LKAYTAGIDEAGRGPLAGPVVAAAVILKPWARLPGLADSKALTPEQREELAPRIRSAAVAWAIGWADVPEIDTLDILQATFLAMRRALLALGRAPRHIQIDGPLAPCLEGLGFSCSCQTIIDGDESTPVISAASVLAKTWRDRWMTVAEGHFPGYGFARHKGYGTDEHLAALAQLGPSLLHRTTFAPVARLCGSVAVIDPEA
jgi:ribonuclease HII